MMALCKVSFWSVTNWRGGIAVWEGFLLREIRTSCMEGTRSKSGFKKSMGWVDCKVHVRVMVLKIHLGLFCFGLGAGD